MSEKCQKAGGALLPQFIIYLSKSVGNNRKITYQENSEENNFCYYRRKRG